MITVRYRLATDKTLFDLATRIKELFGSSNPESEQMESMLPRVSCPPRNGWMQTKMDEAQARNIAEYVALKGLDGFVTGFEVLWPGYDVLRSMDGIETQIPWEYDDIAWMEPVMIDGVELMRDVVDENGNVTGQEVVMVAKRMGDIA